MHDETGLLCIVTRVEPHDQCGITVALLIFRYVADNDAAVLEFLAQLETEHRILEITPHHLLCIQLRGHLIRVKMVARQAAAGHDAFQVEPTA